MVQGIKSPKMGGGFHAPKLITFKAPAKMGLGAFARVGSFSSGIQAGKRLMKN